MVILSVSKEIEKEPMPPRGDTGSFLLITEEGGSIFRSLARFLRLLDLGIHVVHRGDVLTLLHTS